MHPTHQRLLPFLERSRRRERAFKRAIAGSTLSLVVVLLAATSSGRYLVSLAKHATQRLIDRAVGLGTDRAAIDADWKRSRLRDVARTEALLASYDRSSGPAMQRLFREAGMAPGEAVVRWGNYDRTLLLSSKVFEPDDLRSYRLRPNVHSIWLRQITLHEGPFGLFLVPDTPSMREAAAGVGAIVVEDAHQATNSWGLRGPEPDVQAPIRGLVLGDSYMMGTFVGDDDTPPECLRRSLEKLTRSKVSTLNTGHLGYSPEQYYQTLLEYGDRFKPTFVVVSVCPNDFGDFGQVLSGGGDGWEESGYWLEEIRRWCRSKANVPCLIVAIPTEEQIRIRKDAGYPGKISSLIVGGGGSFLDPLDDFINEHLRLMQASPRPSTSPLYNGHVADGHFSPKGAAVWGEVVARRVALLIEANSQQSPGRVH